MNDNYQAIDNSDYLAHHGIKGMHWGIRRYQKADGTLTAEGKRKLASKQARKEIRKAKKLVDRRGYKAGLNSFSILNRETSREDLNRTAKESLAVINKHLKSKDPKVRKAAEKAKKKIERWVKRPYLRTVAKSTAQTATLGAIIFSTATLAAIGDALIHDDMEEG